MRRALRAYYALGSQALGEFGEGYARHGRFLPFAERLGVKPDVLRKARAFARAFSEDDLEVLLNRAGRPVSWGCVRLLVSIKQPEVRKQFIQHILNDGWTARRLAQEIVRRKPKGIRPRRGRKRAIVMASPSRQKQMLTAVAREFLANAAPDEFEEKRYSEWSGKDFQKLLQAVITQSRKTMLRFGTRCR